MQELQTDDTGLSRNSRVVGVLFLAYLAVGLVACQSAALGAPRPSAGGASATAAAAEDAAWGPIVDAAKREGIVSLYSGIVGSDRSIPDTFEKAYPGIKVQALSIPPAELLSRFAAERTAGKYLADVLLGSSGISNLKAAGALSPMLPALMLPEVRNESGWLDGHFWWYDTSEPHSALLFQGEVGLSISYNTKLVDPKQFTSYWDAIDPKWKGKIVGRDVRVPGPGTVQVPFFYKHPDLGPTYIERLFGEMNITLSVDGRQMIDWLGQGRFPLGFVVNNRELRDAAVQGLPVAEVPAEQFKEGAPISRGGGTLALIDQAPHPNAAKVYVNWLLSKEGQVAWQKGLGSNSLRVDIPKDGLHPMIVPKPGGHYVNASTEEYDRTMTAEVAPLITKALGQAGK